MSNLDTVHLLDNFNKRESEAFCEIYKMFHREFFIYAHRLFGDANLELEDCIQDVFLSLYTSSKKFDSINSLKAYIYMSIKNSYLNIIRHNNYVNKHIDNARSDNEMFNEVFECEIYSLIDLTNEILPTGYAKVIELHLEGRDTDEIAEILNRPKQSVYNMKHKAIEMLKKRMPKDKMFLFSIFLS